MRAGEVPNCLALIRNLVEKRCEHITGLAGLTDGASPEALIKALLCGSPRAGRPSRAPPSCLRAGLGAGQTPDAGFFLYLMDHESSDRPIPAAGQRSSATGH